MSSESAPPAAPVLNLAERRILGVLVEKAKTTPDAYPLSVNALVTGCNQKSNRDPVLNLSEVDVEEALVSAQQKGLAIKITGGRVVRWRHALYEALRVDKIELAVLAELLLRGPQTEGELRARAARMEPIADLDALRAVLRPLVERRLVVYLSPEGRRGTILTHGFHAPDELEGLRARHGEEEHGPVPPGPGAAGRPADAGPPAGAEIAALKEAVAALQADVANLAAEVQQLKAALGITPPPS
jgi:uncharacterized protein YceH (UPF0502 family)